MASIKTSGLEIFSKQLNKLAKDIQKINRGALGEAAGMVADKIGAALESMPVRGDKEYATSARKLYGATESEKEQIISNFGISKFRSSGGVTDTSIGFHGYVQTKSPKFNDNVPTGMLMQCINYGNEYRQGTHTIDHAVSGIKSKVESTIEKYIDDKVNDITN